ncbi:MAG: hypothetical protein MZU95_17680 [Desulfomicrobium escambiense]|nr:hypothetical protein [Desulfomicrobium escambiense]
MTASKRKAGSCTGLGKYDSKSVVLRPASMSPEELSEGYGKVVRSVYSFDAIYKKLSHYWNIDFWSHSNRIDPHTVQVPPPLLPAPLFIPLLFQHRTVSVHHQNSAEGIVRQAGAHLDDPDAHELQ